MIAQNGTNKKSENSISPYARMPAMLKPRNRNQEINIQAN